MIYFYPRPPGGGRRNIAKKHASFFTFLSTPSGWRATDFIQGIFTGNWISIHALRVEGDWISSQIAMLQLRISIHALRVEGDAASARIKKEPSDFYPRPPGGGRQLEDRRKHLVDRFLSTPSGWRATQAASFRPCPPVFLSTPSGWRATRSKKHNLCASTTFLSTPSGWRATLYDYTDPATGKHFYPRPPGGGRLISSIFPRRSANISIHALRVEGDSSCHKSTAQDNISIHALRVEGDVGIFVCAAVTGAFLSTPSGWRATTRHYNVAGSYNDFYPRPPGGGRQNSCSSSMPVPYFYPRPPGGGRPRNLS